MRLALLSLVVLLAQAACTKKGEDRQSPPPVDAPPVPATPRTAAPAGTADVVSPAAFPEPLPSGETPAPVAIVLENVTDETQSFGNRESPLAGLSIAHERGLWGTLAFDRAHTTCECRCGGPGRCPKCGPRQIEPLSIAAKSKQRFEWNGMLRRYRRGAEGHCYETFAPPKGSYWMMPGGKDCLARRLELPARGPIVVELSDPPERACDPDPHFAERTARLALSTMAGEPNVLKDRTSAFSGCRPSDARLVPLGSIGTPPGSGACTIAVARGQHEVETRVWLGASDYSTFTDLAGIGIARVRYQR